MKIQYKVTITKGKKCGYIFYPELKVLDDGYCSYDQITLIIESFKALLNSEPPSILIDDETREIELEF